MFHHCRRRPTIFRQSLRLVAELLQLHRTLLVTYTKFFAAALTLVVSSLSSPSHYLLAIPKVGSKTPTIAPDAHGSYSRYFKARSPMWFHRCLRRPTIFWQSLRLVAELQQLHRTLPVTYTKFFAAALTLIVSSLLSPPYYLPSHLAIPKVGNGTPTIQTARLTVVQNVSSSNLPGL